MKKYNLSEIMKEAWRTYKDSRKWVKNSGYRFPVEQYTILDGSFKPNPTFEQILEHKKRKYGLSDEEAYKDIIRSSKTTNKKYDKIAGTEEG